MHSSKKPKIVHGFLGAGDGFSCTLSAGAHQLTADEPESVPGGQDTGPDPYDYLLMSLASCTLITVRMYARRKEWPLEDVYVELKHQKTHPEDCKNCDKPSSKIDAIEKELILEGDLSDEQRQRLLEISKKCPVHRTLLGEVNITSAVSQK